MWSAAEYFVVISCCVFVVANLEMKVTLVIPTGQQGPHVSMFCHCCMDLNDEPVKNSEELEVERA